LVGVRKKEVERLTQQNVQKKKRKGLRAIATMMAVLLFAASMAMTVSAAAPYDFPADAVPVRVTLDGKEVLAKETVIIRSTTYVPLRSFSELMGADSIEWNARTATATVKKGSTTISVANGYYYIVASGRYFYTAEPILNISGRLFVPVRPLAKAFSVDVTWENETRAVALRSTGKTLTPASSYYDSDDLYWLSRIISAESAGESLYGQIAVGNVVMNRVASRQFPNTVYGVIFDRVGGTQFSPVALGTIYRAPSVSSVIAAKICLEGYRISNEILFFMNPRIATSNWISKNRPFAFRIGNHDFYK
jgi:N-acetylmuramoyl-L-alanine amidase